MRAVRLSDFSGGISEVKSPEDFSADACAKARGFVLDTPLSLRSQWHLRGYNVATVVGGFPVVGTTFSSIRGFSAPLGNYLVGITSSGTVHWTVAPSPDDYESGLTWNQVTGITPTTSYRFIGEIPYDGAKQTLTPNVPEGTDPVTTEVILYGKNGLLINSPTGEDAVVLFETSPGTLSSFRWNGSSQRYPAMVQHPSIANLDIAKPGVMPRASVGVVWGDRLVLGDVEWFSVTGTNQSLGPSNTKRYRNALWVSEPGAVDTFNPLNLLVPCSADAQIIDLKVIDLGLLVFTTDASGRDGIILIRGSAASPRIEVLRTGLSAAKPENDLHRNYADYWGETGSVVFIDRLGGVWHTNGSAVVRLDGPTLPPSSAASADDHVATIGPWLFVSRGDRMLVFRKFDTDGAWTELSTPTNFSGTRVKSMTAVGGSLYFLWGNNVWRFAVGSTSSPRGSISAPGYMGNQPEIRLATGTAAIEQEGDLAHNRVLWHRVGVRASSRNSDGALVDVIMRAGPALSEEEVPTYIVPAGVEVGPRFEYVVPAGIGYTNEASVEVCFEGDVDLESITLWVSGGKPVR